MLRQFKPPSLLFTLGLLLIFPLASIAEDWPMWRYNASRGGASTEELAETLHLQWVLELPMPRPAWPSIQEKVQFDRIYEPVLKGKLLFIPSMISDRVTAYDTETGKERWRFYADGPVRFAPVAWKESLYFVSDDSYLYCLNGVTGSLNWKFRGGPSDRKILGNDRLISAWPARSAPVIYEGKIYFGASIWPFMGTFFHALDAKTGKVIWTNSGSGSSYTVQPHTSPAFAGVAPQGYIAATKDRLVVAGGQTMPAVYDRATGKFLHFNVSSPRMGGKGGGGYEVMAGKDFYINRDRMYSLDDGKFVINAEALILTEDSMIGKDPAGIIAYKPGWELKETIDRQGNKSQKAALKPSWSLPLEKKLDQVHIQSGSRLYATGEAGEILAIDIPEPDKVARVSWSVKTPDRPMSMISGDEKLFVSTDQGRVYCFGAAQSDAKIPESNSTKIAVEPRFSVIKDKWSDLAQTYLKSVDEKSGYCLVLGLGTGRLAEEIARQSEYHVIVIDPDAKKIETWRQRQDAMGAYGRKVAAITGDLMAIKLPPYMAELVVSEDPSRFGLKTHKTHKKFVEKVYHLLRPYSGTACFALSSLAHENFSRSVHAAQLDHAWLGRPGNVTLLKRTSAPSGSANWTHQHADASNSVVNDERLVKAPLGLLWFGGPSNEKVLPRHGHGPTPQVAGGRLFIEGRDMIRAVDIYTGRLMWERTLEGVGEYFDYTGHEPGANSTGSNYVSMEDGVYVIFKKQCLRLDPATGKTISKFQLPVSGESDEIPDWGYLGVSGKFLIAGVVAQNLGRVEFLPSNFANLDETNVKRHVQILENLRDFESIPREKDQNSGNYLFVNFNKLLTSANMVKKIPVAVREKAAAQELEKQLENYYKDVPGRQVDSSQALEIKRQLLARYYQLPEFKKRAAGLFHSMQRKGSKKLVAMDRYTGKVFWEHEARYHFRHNAIAIGSGKVFFLDRMADSKLAYYKRRGLSPNENAQVAAIDINKGELIWNSSKRVFGTWLGYSVEHDILLQAGSRGRDRAVDEVGQGMVAYRGANGNVLWENDKDYFGPCLLLGDSVITQGFDKPGFAFNLLTGEVKMQRHPISGKLTQWQYTRKYGCNTAIGCTNMLTFRSAAAGYYDLGGEGGTGNFGGFRSGCTSNLIPAGGILSAPDYTRTCTCSYQNQSSLALVHMPEVEMWTFNPHPADDHTVKRMGLNFGAPGDRRGEDSTLWMDYPSVGGESPVPGVAIESAVDDVEYLRFHTSKIQINEGLNWVASSALKGNAEITVKLIPPEPSEKTGEGKEKRVVAKKSPSIYTIRLLFCELEGLSPGQRTFDVSLQGQTVLGEFDIAKEAGGSDRIVIKKFDKVTVMEDLKIKLESRGERKPLLNGVQIVLTSSES